MLGGNLATRPFYNERAVQGVLGVLAVALGLLALFTVWQFAALSGEQRRLSDAIARDEARTAELRRETQRVRGRLDAQALDATVKAALEANAVIDERTFSWTALFNVIERTIPADVRLRSVTPSLDRGALIVRLIVNAGRVEPVGLFLDRLEAAGAFVGMRSVEEQVLEDGTYNIVCEGRYVGPGAPTAEPGGLESPPAVSPGAGAN